MTPSYLLANGAVRQNCDKYAPGLSRYNNMSCFCLVDMESGWGRRGIVQILEEHLDSDLRN